MDLNLFIPVSLGVSYPYIESVPFPRVSEVASAMDGNRHNAIATAAEDVIDYTFTDKELPWEALQGAVSNMALRYPEGNKRLAMIGDTVVKLVILEDMRAADSPRGK